ncbi:hypothetical protein [Xanthomonas citri]|uniref:hypothetical protein n=1 Tax=Xanthomonas citri TaxID=346 RepID=UPI001E5AEE03|nr:hypothetical protein [Xanthomonas citri]
MHRLIDDPDYRARYGVPTYPGQLKSPAFPAHSRQSSTKVRVFIEWASEIYARIERTHVVVKR